MDGPQKGTLWDGPCSPRIPQSINAKGYRFASTRVAGGCVWTHAYVSIGMLCSDVPRGGIGTALLG